MIKITVNRNKVDIEMHDKEEEVVLAEIAMVMHAMGDCLHDLRAKNEIPDVVLRFAKNAALLGFMDGYNGTDPAERYAHDGN